MPETAAAPATASGQALGMREILESLPHRYPMLLLDRVDELVPGERARGVKCVTANEPFLAGHFPGFPIMPGVLIVDALAQLAGVMLRAQLDDESARKARAERGRPGVLASIQRMRFLRPVVPGDRLRLEVRREKSLAGTHQVHVEAFVEDQRAATGELVIST